MKVAAGIVVDLHSSREVVDGAAQGGQLIGHPHKEDDPRSSFEAAAVVGVRYLFGAQRRPHLIRRTLGSWFSRRN